MRGTNFSHKDPMFLIYYCYYYPILSLLDLLPLSLPLSFLLLSLSTFPLWCGWNNVINQPFGNGNHATYKKGESLGMVFQVIPWDLAPETVLHLPTAVEMALLAVALPHPTAVGTAEATQTRLLSIKYWIFRTIHDHWHENTAEIRINFRNCSKLSYNYAKHCHWTNFSNREQNKLQTWNMWKCRFSCSAILRNWECPPPNSFHLDILTIPFVTIPDGLRTFETRQATFHPFLNFIESVLGDSFGSCQKTCQFWDRDSDDEPRCRCSIPKTSLLLQWNRELLVFPRHSQKFFPVPWSKKV